MSDISNQHLQDAINAQFVLILSLARIVVDSGAVESDFMLGYLMDNYNRLPKEFKDGVGGLYFKNVIDSFRNKDKPLLITIVGGEGDL